MRVGCVLMLTLSLWTVQQGKASPWKHQRTYSSPQFPQYRLLQKTPHFEYRSYEPSTLMSTPVTVNSSTNDLFDRLTNYQAMTILTGEGPLMVDKIETIGGHTCRFPVSSPVNYQCRHSLNGRRDAHARCRSVINEERKCSYRGLGVKTDLDGRACVFPFRYLGEFYYACTMAKATKPWCSLDQDYNRRWGYCQEVRQNTPTGPTRTFSFKKFDSGDGTLPELNVAYVLPREMEAAALATTSGHDVTVVPVPAGNICSRDLETTDMTYEMILATASNLVNHCRQAGHNHETISLVKYLGKDEPRAEMWLM